MDSNPPEVTRRQALRLLLTAAAIGAGACTSRSARRAAPPPASSTTTSSAPPSTTTTTAPPPTTTTTTAPPTTTTTAPPPTTTTTTAPPPAVPAPSGPHPSGAVAGFVAFGDFGGGLQQGDVAAAMARWAAAHRVDALVTTGDNVYDYGEPHLFGPHLDEPYRDLRGSRPMWVTLGNHDVARGHGDAQLAHLGLPALPYATALNGVRLFFLDSNRPDAGQAAWLDQQLAQPGPACSVVVFHAPVHSCGLHGPEASVVAAWEP
ncbi:MAG: metallophosphoesterase family protein, partial [Acidimicrobiia bacterium]